MYARTRTQSGGAKGERECVAPFGRGRSMSNIPFAFRTEPFEDRACAYARGYVRVSFVGDLRFDEERA